ncbi:MAG TPA: PilZ domain-containing protein [Polyangia bacterium]|nr:PilZ domain-containing protein [Polyangia bacterium]
MGSPDELAEFQALSLKVSAKTANEAERARWRELRTRLAKPQPPPPPPQVARQHSRAQRKLKVELAPVATMHATFTEEVSPGGLKLRVPGPLDTGALMVVRLELGEPGPLTLSARVAWCRRDGGHYLAGLELIGLRDDERERIEAWAAVPATPPPSTART